MNELLTIAGTVAAIQVLFAGCREWRSACRIVAVRGVDADDYARFGCIPLQFAGTRFGIVRAAVAASGFFWVRPATRKNAYAARRVRGVRDGDEIDYRDIRPGDLLHIELDDGEHLRQFDRSMRRGVASFYRTIAVRDLQCPGENLNAHCITVRAQGSLVDSADDEGSAWLEFKVISAAPRSNLRSGHSALSELPEDAIELLIVPAATYVRVRRDMILRYQGRLRRLLLRRNPNPRAALAHAAAKYVLPVLALSGLGALFSGWRAAAAILLASVVLPFALLPVPVAVAVPIAFVVFVRSRIRSRRRPVEPLERPETRIGAKPIPLRYLQRPAPQIWTGATARSMSAGRRINATDARSTLAHLWQQHSHGLLPIRR